MKKTSAYVWAGLMGFIGSYVPLLSLIGSLFAAFAISTFFTPIAITLLAFGLAIGFGSLVGIYNIRQVYRENQQNVTQKEKLKEESEKRKQLKSEHEKHKEASLQSVNLINSALSINEEYEDVNHLLDFLLNKTQHMHHDEKVLFLSSPECAKINAILSTLQDNNLDEKAFEEKIKNLKNTLKSILTVEEVNQVKENLADSRPSSIPNLSTKMADLGIKPENKSTKVSLSTTIGITVKTAVLSFAVILSATAITAALVVGLSPAIIIAAAPMTVALVSTGIAALAIGIGSLAGFFYHKVIGPQKMHDDFMKAKVNETVKKNQRLSKKLGTEKAILNDQKNLLSTINSHMHSIHNNILRKSDMLHKVLDPEYRKSKKQGVKEALAVANHTQIKDHQPAPRPEMVVNAVLGSDLELASASAPPPDHSVDTAHLTSLVKNLSATEKAFLLQQLNNECELEKSEPQAPHPHRQPRSEEV